MKNTLEIILKLLEEWGIITYELNNTFHLQYPYDFIVGGIIILLGLFIIYFMFNLIMAVFRGDDLSIGIKPPPKK